MLNIFLLLFLIFLSIYKYITLNICATFTTLFYWFKFLQNIFHLFLLRFSFFCSFLFFLVSTPQTFLFFFILLILSHQLTTPKTLPTLTASFSNLFLLSSPSHTGHTPTITTSPFHRTSVHLLLNPFRPRITPTAAHFFRPRTMLNVRTPAYTRLLLTTTFYYWYFRATTRSSVTLRCSTFMLSTLSTSPLRAFSFVGNDDIHPPVAYFFLFFFSLIILFLIIQSSWSNNFFFSFLYSVASWLIF